MPYTKKELEANEHYTSLKERDEEIEILNKDLELIRNKITNTTSDLNSKTRHIFIYSLPVYKNRAANRRPA